jgi:hypothetical protein
MRMLPGLGTVISGSSILNSVDLTFMNLFMSKAAAIRRQNR